ncbi:helix-turn-helix domain-containing protein [Nocardia farcinica]|uniref:Putative DNA-binding protein n=1 Tax=Nocardia farcinica (strain IFM 10152) TaxID=247156 RepID=Q5YQB5_NOCFA|nr:helix-turn-helix domain-containing protein [Nocardia farcinica]BAD59626.1 putative DNA-binding protein [Nocardia farcinica IFM 10152]
MGGDLGERVRSVRKRRGLTQRELADASGLSVSLIRKLEQGDRPNVRVETARKLAVALRVRTSALQAGHTDAEHADAETSNLWEPVRRALVVPVRTDDADDPPTSRGVEAAVRALAPLVDGHRYRDIAQVLPGLLADAETLDDHEGRVIRARLLSLVAFLLVGNRQFDVAAMTVDRAVDAAPERGIAVGAINSLIWSHLRQGNLAAARDLAVEWADDLEPARFSTATPGRLAPWGRFWLYVANVCVRDNSPGATADALSLARSAAVRIGREMIYDRLPHRAFGPITVAQATAECAVTAQQPRQVLTIAEALPTAVPAATIGNRLRHRLDVANAHTQLRQYGEAVAVLREVRAIAPEWIVQQRYARDILGAVVEGRRTLTADMRELADFIRLEY